MISGPSGSGKTTLFNLVGCLDKPTTGTVRLEEHDVGGLSAGDLARLRARRIGFVFQSFNLIPVFTALENVELALQLAGDTSSDRRERAKEALAEVGLGDYPNRRPNQLSGMERDAERLYDLIWRQFVACQMPPAEYLSTSVSVSAGSFELRAKGRILKFDGYTRVLPQQIKPGEDDVLPEMNEGELLKLLKLDPSQHFTKPPARYSEASLVKELEKRGIGRPST